MNPIHERSKEQQTTTNNKNMKKLFLLPLFLLATGLFAQDTYQVGDKVQNFTLKNIDGNMVSMETAEAIKGYILVFTCNHCPYSVLYEDRIIALDKKFKTAGYPVIAINPNDPVQYPDDDFENMIRRAEEKGFTFPYLVDETQEVARAFGASRTPHVFLVERMEQDFFLKYIGAIDDSPRDESAIEQRYVEDAIASLLAGEEIATSFTKAIGCTIKWKK
jgi:peroxiredoxin